MHRAPKWTRDHLCAAMQGFPAAARMSQGPSGAVDASDAARRSDSAATAVHIRVRSQLFIVESRGDPRPASVARIADHDAVTGVSARLRY